MKDVTIHDATGKVTSMFTYVKGTYPGSPVTSIAVGLDTVTRMTNDTHGNIISFNPGSGQSITYTYDDKHHPCTLLPAKNEHLQFSVYATPQTFVNNPLTITAGGTTKTYTYQYNQYGYPTNATVSDGSTIKYEYVARK
jgi:YD repeat-containing protein